MYLAEVFRRVEEKYIMTRDQYLAIKEMISEKMIEDSHGKSTICNLYFDTNEYELIRHSITKPIYKDKVRLRSYNLPTLDSKVYLEIKRKYEGVVSKRRIEMTLNDYYNFEEVNDLYENKQILNELNYYFQFYKLKTTMFLSYFRRAFYAKDNMGFRVTFDSNIIARNYDLKIENGIYGDYILDKDKYIMEIKILDAIPLWFVKILDQFNISPCGFSKYGEAYTKLILKENKVMI